MRRTAIIAPSQGLRYGAVEFKLQNRTAAVHWYTRTAASCVFRYPAFRAIACTGMRATGLSLRDIARTVKLSSATLGRTINEVEECAAGPLQMILVGLAQAVCPR